jgi:hypothetical protein
MKKESAVDWLYKEMIKKSVNDPSNNVLYILQQAKEMEKEQIINGFEEGFKENYRDNGISGEEYYKETYTEK